MEELRAPTRHVLNRAIPVMRNMGNDKTGNNNSDNKYYEPDEEELEEERKLYQAYAHNLCVSPFTITVVSIVTNLEDTFRFID